MVVVCVRMQPKRDSVLPLASLSGGLRDAGTKRIGCYLVSRGYLQAAGIDALSAPAGGKHEPS